MIEELHGSVKPSFTGYTGVSSVYEYRSRELSCSLAH